MFSNMRNKNTVSRNEKTIASKEWSEGINYKIAAAGTDTQVKVNTWASISAKFPVVQQECLTIIQEYTVLTNTMKFSMWPVSPLSYISFLNNWLCISLLQPIFRLTPTM